MLHASKLEFLHPKTKKQVKCEAPWPEDFKHALAVLRGK
jgi:23S rRNA pseudouridine1911/1915/1917 synthase